MASSPPPQIDASASPGSRPVPQSSSHPYTCNSCQVAYRSIDLQKGHMRSDWHRYNLKRRVASLPPISSDVFTEKVLQARAVSTAEVDKALFERTCESCQKTYFSENAFQNHLLSHKHKAKRLAAGQQLRPDDETTSVISSTFSLGEPTLVPKDQNLDSDAEDEFNQVIESLQKTGLAHQQPSPVKRPAHPHPLSEEAEQGESRPADGSPSSTSLGPQWTLNSCIFCNYASPSMPLNASHMERFHGMFIPEKAYLCDLQGLVAHLQRRVGQYHECLGCGKIKSTVFAVQTHMRDKGHCKIRFDTEQEQLAIGDFYDFRATYSHSDHSSDSGSTEGEQGGAKLTLTGRSHALDSDAAGLDDGGAGDGWETDSSLSSLDSADLTAVPAEGHIHQFERLNRHPHHSRHDPRHHHQVDGWHSRAHKHSHAIFHDDYELHLPSGKSVGHRSLNRYFRQNLGPYSSSRDQEECQGLELEGPDSSRPDESPLEGPEQEEGGHGRGRALMARGAQGMVGLTDDKKRMARRREERGRDRETMQTKKREWAYGKRANNQKNYYYRYDGGG